MLKRIIFILLITAISGLLSACSSVPFSDRKQMTLIPESQMLSMSRSQYSEVKSKSKIVTGTSDAQRIQRVGRNLSIEIDQWLKEEGINRTFEWEFVLINSDQVNAWCMPGGKVAFYTGIMRYCDSDDAVAVIMGHEIAHAICRHGNERMSAQLLTLAGGVALAVALREQPSQTRNLWLLAYGVGTTVGAILPFSRGHESEADRLGLYLMARAGYDPRESVAFWQRMKQGKKTSVPEFLSTHPSHETRIKNLQKEMPKAMVEYQKSKNRKP